MTSDKFIPLSDLERDALGELSNIAMAKAANSLRQMIQHEVLLAVPSVDNHRFNSVDRSACSEINQHCFAPILLKKSFCRGSQKFCGL